MFQNQNEMQPSTNITFLGQIAKVKVNQAKDVKLQPSQYTSRNSVPAHCITVILKNKIQFSLRQQTTRKVSIMSE